MGEPIDFLLFWDGEEINAFVVRVQHALNGSGCAAIVEDCHRAHLVPWTHHHLPLRLTAKDELKYRLSYVHIPNYSLLSISKNSSSVRIETPNASAFLRFSGPMFSPARMKLVFLLTEPTFLPPWASIMALYSSREC